VTGAALRAIGLATATAVLLSASPVLAKPSDARALELAKKGNKLYSEGDFEGARDAFEEGYKIEPDPLFLYGVGQALNQLGDCRGAIRKYKKVEESPTASNEMRELAQAAIYACADKLASDDGGDAEEPEDEPEDEPAEDDPSVGLDEPVEDPVVEDAPPKGNRWYLDPIGDSLVAVGLVGTGAGVGLLVAAQVEQGKDAASYEEFDDRQRKVRTFRIAGGVTAGIGGALLIGGIVRWILVGTRRPPSSTARVGVLYDGAMSGLSLSGRF
jgi:tetratricopeptide (TPR) repeat protein